MPILYVLSGPDIGKVHEVVGGAILGRAVECEVTLRGGSVSRKHARIEQHEGVWTLVDMDSRNGISSTGVRRPKFELLDGETFLVGELELRFRQELQGTEGSPVGEMQPARPAPAIVQDPVPSQERGDPPSEMAEPDDGFEFEGEELFEAPPPSMPSPAPAPAPPERGPTARETAPTTSRAEPGLSPQAQRLAAAGIRAPRGAAIGGDGVRDAGRPILQYSRAEESSGFLTADLGQYPLWVRALVVILGVTLFAAVAYLAFRGTSSLKPGTPETEFESSVDSVPGE